MTSSSRFAFTKVFVDNLPAQARFYQSAFGLTEKARLAVGEGANALEEIILTSGRGDDSTLVLWRFLERPTPAAGEAVLGFNVTDAEGTVRNVESAGGVVVDPVREMTDHRVLVAFVKDPEGHLLEIVQNL
ncbi:putative enzyme related to lactoylglutathione lyase [Rhodococcus sp. OK519]|uniref:VOC family protein n=1 Tax=Rhodococcus sp. OK519 TaxID=2135729 RepID=UPI000D3547F1|nr:putative enzyme related to lactoylglutathione lyase [Rhodococcus sp. OK519]